MDGRSAAGAGGVTTALPDRQLSAPGAGNSQCSNGNDNHDRPRNAHRYTLSMTQIAVKLPDALVHELDELVAQGLFPSRSSAVRRAVEAIVAGQRRDALELAYADGYRQAPESETELAEAKRLAKQAIDDEPWEKWW